MVQILVSIIICVTTVSSYSNFFHILLLIICFFAARDQSDEILLEEIERVSWTVSQKWKQKQANKAYLQKIQSRKAAHNKLELCFPFQQDLSLRWPKLLIHQGSDLFRYSSTTVVDQTLHLQTFKLSLMVARYDLFDQNVLMQYPSWEGIWGGPPPSKNGLSLK